MDKGEEMDTGSPKTKRGESRSGHGISFEFNKQPKSRTTRDAAIRRNHDNQKALGSWHNESRGKPNEIPFPGRRKS